MLIIANTSSSQNKISSFLGLLNTFNVKKTFAGLSLSRSYSEWSFTDLYEKLKTKLKTNRYFRNVVADAHGSSQSLLKRAFHYSAQVTVKPTFYIFTVLSWALTRLKVRKASSVLSYNCRSSCRSDFVLILTIAHVPFLTFLSRANSSRSYRITCVFDHALCYTSRRN